MDTKPVDNGALDAPLPRRTFVKTALYVTPAILTLKAAPAFASYGSGPAPSSDESNSHSGKSKSFDPPRGPDNAPGQQKKQEKQEKEEKKASDEPKNQGPKHSK